MTRVRLPCPLSRLVPHQPPMRWLDELVSYTPDCGTAEARLPADHLLVTASGELHHLAAVELVAQAAAAHEGYRRALEDLPVGGGFLAGVRDFGADHAPRAGQLVTAVAQRTLSIGAMEVVRGRLECEGRLLAHGDLLFFLSDDLVPAELHTGRKNLTAPTAATDDPTVLPALGSCLQTLDRNRRRAVYNFPSTFPAFAGHFPELPILPAVVALVCATEVVKLLETEPVGIRYVKRAKFTRPIPPEADIEVVCSPATGEGARLWRLQLNSEGERAAVMTVGEARPPTGGSEPGATTVTSGDGAC